MRCAKCGAEPGESCRTVTGLEAGAEYDYYVHAARYRPLAEEFERGRVQGG